MSYNAENQLVGVTGPSMTTSFLYDGGGARVKSMINGTTTYFVGGHYEVTGSQVTKYYFAGAQRIAMRKNGTLNYILTDHLGSTSLTTDANGAKVSEIRYKPGGEVRYTWMNAPANTSPAYELVKYQFTGQYSYDVEFGLLFFNARWLDPVTGRFAQADSIVPTSTQGTQAWDRYAFVNNNPVRYNDPTGHWGFDLSATVNSIINWQLSGVNALLGTGFTSADVVKGYDALATVCDWGAAAISSAIAIGDVAAGVIGYGSGAGVGFALAGEAGVVTGFPGAGVGIGIFELNPVTQGLGAAADVLGVLSTVYAAESDIITGDTNITGSVSVSGNGIQISQSSSIGRDTLINVGLTTMGFASPIGLIDAPLDWIGLADDYGMFLPSIPESIPVTDYDIEIEY